MVQAVKYKRLYRRAWGIALLSLFSLGCQIPRVPTTASWPPVGINTVDQLSPADQTRLTHEQNNVRAQLNEFQKSIRLSKPSASTMVINKRTRSILRWSREAGYKRHFKMK